MEISLTISAAFIIGLLGATHCVGMCGGITSALSMGIAPGIGENKRRWSTLLVYNLGRITSYATAGAIVGTFGWILGEQGSAVSIALRSFAATLLILMGLYIANWWKGLTYIETLGKGLWRFIQPLSRNVLPVKNLRSALALGLIWGWLPCGLVYSTLIWASMSHNPIQSATLMAAFGLGTLPAILTTGLLAEKFASAIRYSPFRSLSGILLILYGLWTFHFVQQFINHAIQS